MFLALSHGETGFMKPNPMKLVASCDMALSLETLHMIQICIYIIRIVCYDK